ncbi:hypothetical protein IEQ34_008153 [Dendrobium chrysotoxum]|uniref:NB-ARC domain-containing protein n=1 Tax=Dendrobium chrysotoxum TaxID=161865 RepID=A0AAV7H3B7_DENCH|nr:hypothetical protein IEQ34_008153 [Dendrobium chrysotoxum]
MKKRLVKIVKRALKIDPNLKRLEEAVQKLYRVSTNVASFLYLVKDAKQEQQLQLYRARETGSSPKNDLIGRGKEKKLVMEWLRNPSNEPRGSDLYRNISLLSIVGHGGMGKTTLLQHVYKDEITKEFDLKMWVCVSNNFDVKKLIADMLESLKKERPRLETLGALQGRLEEEVMSKKFLLVLDDIWEEDEEKDKSKWEDVLAPLASGGFGSKILITTRTDSVALMFANVIKKKKKIVILEGLEEDECLQLLNSHAFAGVENSPDDHKKLRAIAGETVKKLSRSPLAAKVIGAVLNENLDERHWRTVLESNLLDQNSINSILRLSYIVLPNHLLNCFAFCCMFPQDHTFDKDDLVRMWIALGFIQPSQRMTMEDIGGRYFDALVKKVLFDKDIISSICGIGKLKSLQELNMFDLRDVSGYRIGELENMNDLCKLGINYLENVKDAEEAYSANLCAKRRLTDLTLCWSNTDSRNIDLDENVLDNLQPPKCLRNLRIQRYMGARSAIWMKNVNPISNLEKIELSICSEWETLPPFGQFPFLKSLKLLNMPKVKWLESKFNVNDKYHAFPSLEVLHISDLEALEDWFEAGVAAEDGCLFPCLIKLALYNCPKLKELPSLPSKLKSLEIVRIGWTTLNFCSNSNPIPLETLNVCRCRKITSLLLADEIARLAALRYLTITKCPNLISLGRYREVETTNNCHLILNYLRISDPSVLLMEPLRSIASLKELRIIDNDELVSFPNEAEQWFLKVRSSLSQLHFMFLASLESLPSCLESLSSIQKLCIRGVPMLRELPNFPPNLERLTISGCHPELEERYGADGGSDRHKIAHIPHISIRP